jgi:hypothetical protein
MYVSYAEKYKYQIRIFNFAELCLWITDIKLIHHVDDIRIMELVLVKRIY